MTLSTERNKFISKCREVTIFFNTNNLKLNLGKSGFLIINPKSDDRKCNLVSDFGILKYKHKVDYLGICISDSGVLKHDVKLFVDQKRANVSIKFSNFCQVNRNAPLFVELQVLD